MDAYGDVPSSLCSACRVPIFSTPAAIPSILEGKMLFQHYQCAKLLPEFLVHELHPNHQLILHDDPSIQFCAQFLLRIPTCSNCNEACGSRFYKCQFPECDFRLDLMCVLKIVIKHKSHPHGMSVIRQRYSSSLTCSACDANHEPLVSASASATLSYSCKHCGYSIHQDCASLPDIIHRGYHHHPLLLTYNLPTATDSKCGICFGVITKTSWRYSCRDCDYLVHIRCPIARPNSLKPGFSKEEIIIDPDSESSSLCKACRIPIFSTPSVSFSHEGERLFLHKQCSTGLPWELDHELHHHSLYQIHNSTNTTTICSNCEEVCGNMFYKCWECDYRLDLLCASQIKIVHRSHHHTMMVIRLKDSSSTCSACGTKHESPPSEKATISYLCNLCGYWIHPECASLPNAIVHFAKHPHSLFVTYSFREMVFGESDSPFRSASDSKCVVCKKEVEETSGVYICLKCDGYFVHIRCALTRPETFKTVFIRDAKVSDLARLPMPDVNTSLVPYIKPSARDDRRGKKILHQHRLTFHGIDDGRQSISTSRVCNACVQFVSPPFFSCSECPDFFLHTSCARLPSKIEHRVHKHPLTLSLKPPKTDISGGFSCIGCGVRTNGFAYSCESCGDDYNMDVSCGLIKPAITHDSHEKTHILFMSRDTNLDEICSCCGRELSGICYECNTCPEFKLHARCALLPTTLSHSFDKHPLLLTATATGGDEICEVCEEELEKKKWHYSCGECDQSFHIDCIPSVDLLSKMKLGSTVKIDGHPCPLTLVRVDDAVCLGYRCGDCRKVLKSSEDGLVYECPDCFFGIHHKCVDEKLKS